MSPGVALSTVMVVDDEPMIRKLVAAVLSGCGYHVVDAESPQHAIRILDSHPSLDLLLTDLVMPEVNGCELALQMRQKRPDLKVLFMSGFEPLYGAGIPRHETGYLQKPFRITELVERVRQMLGPRR